MPCILRVILFMEVFMIRKMLGIFLIIVCMTGVSYAYKLSLNGYNETELRFIGNSSVGDGGSNVDNDNGTYVKQQLRIWGFLEMDEKTKLIMRITPINHRWGTSYQHNTSVIKGTAILDRAWVQYKPVNDLTIDCGFMTAANYSIKGWAQGWYNGGFTEFGPRSGGRVEYAKDGRKYWIQYEKTYETDDSDMFYDVNHNKDSDAVIIGTDTADNGPLKTHAYAAYYSTYGGDTDNNDRSSLGGGYVSAEYKISENLSTTLSGSYVAGKAYDSGGIYMKGEGEDVSAYGLYGDLVFKNDSFTAGFDAEYSSYDKEKGFFSLGGDLDRMYIMDDIMGDYRGVPASTSFRAYVTKPVGKFEVTPAIAYYMSNVKDSDVAITYGSPYNAKKTWTKDTSALELDLKTTYQVSPVISLAGGYAVAFIDNVSTGSKDSNGNYETYDADPVHVAWFRFTASFK